MEEFRNLKAEIFGNQNAARQVVSLGITAASVLVAAVPVVIEHDGTVIFLLAPLVFLALSWVQLRYTLLTLEIGRYLRHSLFPRVRQTIAASTSLPVNHDVKVLEWEDHEASLLKNHGLLGLPIAGANFGILILAAVASAIGFVVVNINDLDHISVFEWTLLVMDGVLLIYNLAWAVWAETQR